jgi:hypothetical protein
MNKAAKKNNETLYPLVFLVLFPLAGGSAAMEYGLFGGSIGTGAGWGALLGCVLFVFWKLRARR